MEGDELKLHFWVGRYECPIETSSSLQGEHCLEGRWKGDTCEPDDAHEIEGYRHTLADGIKIKAIIPLLYVDQLTQEEKRVGALIVDSVKEGFCFS